MPEIDGTEPLRRLTAGYGCDGSSATILMTTADVSSRPPEHLHEPNVKRGI